MGHAIFNFDRTLHEMRRETAVVPARINDRFRFPLGWCAEQKPVQTRLRPKPPALAQRVGDLIGSFVSVGISFRKFDFSAAAVAQVFPNSDCIHDAIIAPDFRAK